MVADVSDTVNNRVTHIDVGRCHIYLRTENSRTVRKSADGHSLEEVKIFLYASDTLGTVFTRLCESASVLSDFIGCQVAYISLTHFDELYGTFVNEIEVA